MSFLRRAVAVAAVALIATTVPAAAHNQDFSGGWSEWQGWRTAQVFSTNGYNGAAQVRTLTKYHYPGNNLFGFELSYISDHTQNGGGDCTQVWVDFNRGHPNAVHRNPTTIRHCNTVGNVYGYHGGVTDVMSQYWAAFAGWDITICRALLQPDGRWIQRDCTNELGHKPMHWIESEEEFNGPATAPYGIRYGRFDWEITDANCHAGLNDSSDRYGCWAYLHVV